MQPGIRCQVATIQPNLWEGCILNSFLIGEKVRERERKHVKNAIGKRVWTVNAFHSLYLMPGIFECLNALTGRTFIPLPLRFLPYAPSLT